MIYIKKKSDHLRLDQVNGIFYYSIPEQIKKYCFQMELLLNKYFVSEKNIEIARYLIFQKFKQVTGFADVFINWSSYPVFENDQSLNGYLQNHFISGKESFCFMFFLITVLQKFSVISKSKQSLKIRTDIFTLVGLMQLNICTDNHFWYLNILGNYFKKRISEKYSQEIGFGRGLITLLELEYLLHEKCSQIGTFALQEYCSESIYSLIFSLKSHLERKYSHHLVRAHSALSNKHPPSRSKCETTTLDDLSQRTVEREVFDNSINGIFIDMNKIIELCSLLTAFQTLMSRIIQPALKQKLKELIQVIVSISMARKQPQNFEADEYCFPPNTIRTKRLEPLRVKKRSTYPKSVIRQASDTNGIALKSTIVLPPLQKIGN